MTVLIKLWRLLFGPRFPHEIREEWFAYQSTKQKNVEKLPPYWDGNNRYINYKRGDVVPLRRKGKWLAFYSILGWSKGAYGDDLAMWDDGRQYHVKLHHIERKKAVEDER